MAQQISDLVINLDVDSATFTEQVARIRGQLRGMADESDKVQARMASATKKQTDALKQMGDEGSRAATDIQEKQAAAADAMQKDWKKTAESVDEAHQRIAALRQQIQENNDSVAAAKKEQDDYTESLYREIDGIKALTGEMKSLTSFQSRLRQARSDAKISQEDYLALVSRATERQIELRTEEEKTAAARVSFIQKLKSQVAVQSLSTTELLRHKAAQLGVSDAADIYIRKLDEAKKATNDLAKHSAAARREIGIMIGELARGNIGALRGSGITLANRAGWIDQLMTLRGLGIAGVIGGITAAIYGLGKAWYEGSQEGEEFNKQLILTGDYAGRTSGQLQALARSISGNGITQHAAAGVLAKVVGSGHFAASQIEGVTRAAVAMQEATGKAVDETIKEFQKLYDDPTKASEDLNSQLHYLTAAQFEYISALEQRGDKEKAGQEAADAYSHAEQQRSQQVIDNLGLIERAALATRNAFKSMWDELLNIGRADGDATRLQTMKNTLAEIQDNAKEGIWGRFKNNAMGVDKDQLEEKIKNLEFAMKSQDGYNQKKTEANKLNNDAIDGQILFNKYTDAGTTNIEKQAQAEKELNKAIEANARAAKETKNLPDGHRVELWTAEQIAKARAGIQKLYKLPKEARAKKPKSYVTPAGDRAEDQEQKELLALQAQLDVLKQQKGINDTISQQRKDLWMKEAQFTVLEEASGKRQLTTQEKSLLASKDQVLALAEQKAILGDQIVAQKQLAAFQKTSTDYVTQQQQATELYLKNATVSDRQGQLNAQMAQLKIGYEKNPASKLTGKEHDDALKAYQDEVTAAQKSFDERSALRDEYQKGAEKSWADFADSATDLYQQTRDLETAALNGFSTQLSQMLTRGKASFKSFTVSIISMFTEMMVKISMVKGAKMAAGAFGWDALIPHADGGVYTSPSLSAYSGTVVDRPTFFAFAKGGGVMGEAGPEAILPLRRGANGKLGVVASGVGGSGNGGVTVNMGGVFVGSNPSQQGSGQSGGGSTMSSAGSEAIMRQLKPAIVSVISDQAQKPGTPLWNAINGKR
ncbi:phage tail tape measure protein [Enterobacter sp. PTB]|uniref:phage tail tape measure protein n=1 Tax=Enterobacter sp. PTB TaxID=3143437 RepID=UPI003DA85873